MLWNITVPCIAVYWPTRQTPWSEWFKKFNHIPLYPTLINVIFEILCINCAFMACITILKENATLVYLTLHKLDIILLWTSHIGLSWYPTTNITSSLSSTKINILKTLMTFIGLYLIFPVKILNHLYRQ